MYFGNETPFYLRPLPNRGLRRLDAEAQQHYPGYRHPLDFASSQQSSRGGCLDSSHDGGGNAAAAATSASGRAMPGTSGTTRFPKRDAPYNPVYNITEAERVHPHLTPTDRLRHERDEERARDDARTDIRRRRAAEREQFFMRRQQEEAERAAVKAAAMAGTAVRNIESEGRDTITHHCFTVEAQAEKDFRDAAGRHAYFSRQRRLVERQNGTAYNIVTWQPREEVVVPPMPHRPEPATTQDG